MITKGNILAVDDTPSALKLLSNMLRAEGYEVRSAINGELALRAAVSDLPDLVLLDIRMPVMDGFEVCRQLKAMPETQEVPVIFVSAVTETEEKIHGFEMGAVDYVTKPYQREELLARVHTHIELYRLRTNLEKLVEGRTAELLQSQRKLSESEALFHNYFMLAQVGLAIISVDQKCLDVNDALCEMLGYTKEELLRKTWVELTHPDDLKADLQKFRQLLAGDIQRYRLEKRFIHKEGDIIFTYLAVTCQRDSDNSVDYVIASLEDITERKIMEEQIRQLAFYDPLTHLPNRRLLEDRLEQAMNACKRTHCYGAVLFLDLDNFKPINDKHGHHIGDLLLIEVAQRLAHCVRAVDTVARFGGDEFVILLTSLTAGKNEAFKQAVAIAEKIHKALHRPHLLNVVDSSESDTIIEHHCPGSIGVALFNGHDVSQQDILKCADKAMYHAKESGRNCIKLYDSPFFNCS